MKELKVATTNGKPTNGNSHELATTEIAPTVTPLQAPERSDDSSALGQYLREIGQVKLLTPKEEKELGRRIQKGDLEARKHMIEANLRLVVKIARDYEWVGLPLLDLINEGNIGLMKAVERFDPSKGSKFSTYASFWIKQTMRRALSNQSKLIRLPVHVFDKAFHMERIARELHDTLGREPTDDELADEVGTTAEKIARIRRVRLPTLSLDAPISNESGGQTGNTVADLVADENTPNVSEEFETDNMKRVLWEMLGQLSQREAHVLKGRFGLDDQQEQTLESLAVPLKLTRERIRQIEGKALRKLRWKFHKMEKLLPELRLMKWGFACLNNGHS